MDDIMALCKRRGFIFQASEIYGGINGFWDYGPLGAQLKKNLKDAWWQDCVLSPPTGPDGREVEMVGLDTCIIQHPKVWEASGHVGGFNDPRVDCKQSKGRYRADHLFVLQSTGKMLAKPMYAFIEGDEESEKRAYKLMAKYLKTNLPLPPDQTDVVPLAQIPLSEYHRLVGPDANEPGTLTEPRAFNLMFKTYVGATASEDDVAYLRPETAQGIFIQFKNVVDTSRVRVPFGIAQMGKAFRNEVTPRNFTFRSREFEQMEIEFFCHKDDAAKWYAFWRDWRLAWWRSIGLGSDNLQLREHDKDELAHYAKEGAGTSDIEYRFPFTYPGFGELEGVADRSDYDLRQHQEHARVKLEYFDTERGELAPNGQPKGERYLPNVIEPSAGADRGVLAVLCEAYTPDDTRPSKVYMKFHPRIAPIKAAVFPLVNKDGMPEVADKLARDLKKRYSIIETDAKQSIGKRYARMDEAGCPFCFTIDGDTLKDNTVTLRHRDTQEQERIGIDKVASFLGEKLGLQEN
ncbi:MAG: glycine--tRNA ligase [Phycisphaeraceae bacterium]|nr:MAG: glycine--tRNA ligase [Phycisphaeraceae bacterium]